MSRQKNETPVRTLPIAGADAWAIFGLLLSLVTAAAARAQTATVSGALLNHESHAPVEGARVSIIGTGLNASSDAAGRFIVTGVPAGVRVMQVHAIGFAVGSWVVELTEGQVLRQDFDLAPRALEVEGVTVTAPGTDNWRSEESFEDRRHRTTGFFITKEQIAQRNAANISELLRTVPGVMTSCTSRGCVIRMGRSVRQCSPEFYLDGYPATFSTGPNFPITQIRGIEVYRDYFEAPPEFQRPNLTCGVIAIWTVEPGTALGRH